MAWVPAQSPQWRKSSGAEGYWEFRVSAESPWQDSRPSAPLFLALIQDLALAKPPRAPRGGNRAIGNQAIRRPTNGEYKRRRLVRRIPSHQIANLTNCRIAGSPYALATLAPLREALFLFRIGTSLTWNSNESAWASFAAVAPKGRSVVSQKVCPGHHFPAGPLVFRGNAPPVLACVACRAREPRENGKVLI